MRSVVTHIPGVSSLRPNEQSMKKGENGMCLDVWHFNAPHKYYAAKVMIGEGDFYDCI
jgi:hypothetical protein